VTILSVPDVFEIQVIDNAKIRFQTAGDGFVLPSVQSKPTQVLDGSWHHIAVTYDLDSVRFYVDGLVNDEIIRGVNETFDEPYQVSELLLGSTRSFPEDKREKWLDEFRLFNRARSSQEIVDSMNRTLRGSEIDETLLVYYDFNTDLGQPRLEVFDRSLYSRNLVLGEEEVGSKADETFERVAPKYVSTELPPIFESSPYVKIEHPFGHDQPSFRNISLPVAGQGPFSIEILTLPGLGILLKTPQGDKIETFPYSLDGNELVVSMLNPDVAPFETLFSYQVTSNSSVSPPQKFRVGLVRIYTPTPGGSGYALKCNGFSLFFYIIPFPSLRLLFSFLSFCLPNQLIKVTNLDSPKISCLRHQKADQ